MFTLDKARQIFPDTLTADAVPAITARFKLLSAEDQLALIWFAYLEMGQTITVAAPGLHGYNWLARSSSKSWG